MDNKIYVAQDYSAITERSITSEGYLVAPGRLARTGVQNYRAMEFGLDVEKGMDPMKLIRMYRPSEEVFAAESMASFENQPITIEHPKGLVVNVDNWKEVAKGELCNVTQSGDMLNGKLIVKAKDAIEAIQTGKVQLSLGYTFMVDWTPGKTANGEPYDGVQRNIRGNHVALVDAARCGSACRIADSNPLTTGDKAMNLQKVIVDGIPFEVSDTAAAAINNLLTARDSAKAELKVANDKLATMITPEKHTEVLTAKDSEITELKKDVMTPAQRDAMVADWGKMIGDAKTLAPEVVVDGKTCHAVRKEVVSVVIAKDAKAKAAADAVLGGKTLEAADADIVRAVFNVLVATSAPAVTHSAGDSARVAQALAGKQAEHKAADAQPVGREAMLARQANAWQGDKK